MANFSGPSLTPDWFSGLAGSLGDAIENRRAGQLLSQYVDDVWSDARPASGLDYAAGLGRPPSAGGAGPPDYADSRIQQAFETAAVNGGATGTTIPERYRSFFETAGQKYGFDPQLLARQANAESAFNPDAVSPAGAVGISQFMPATAERFGIDPRDPAQAIDAQAHYNALNRDRFGGNEGLVFAAYNWGEGNVEDWLAKGGDPSRMPAETRDYVQKITGRPIEAHLQGTQTAAGADLGPGAGDVPGSSAGLPGGFGRAPAAYPMPDRETLSRMARNSQLRPLVVDIIKAQQKGLDPRDLLEVSPGASVYNPRTGQFEATAPGRPNTAAPFVYRDAGTYTSVIDRDTGQEVQRIPKDVQGASAARERGDVQGKAEASLRSVETSSDMALAQINRVRNHPEIDWGTGVTAVGSDIPGHPGHNFRADVDVLRGDLFLSSIQELRGMGALSNAEGQAATQAATNLSTTQDKDQFLRNLDVMQTIIERGRENARAIAAGEMAPGVAGAPVAAPPTATRQRARNPQTGEVVEYDPETGQWIPVQ